MVDCTRPGKVNPVVGHNLILETLKGWSTHTSSKSQVCHGLVHITNGSRVFRRATPGWGSWSCAR